MALFPAEKFAPALPRPQVIAQIGGISFALGTNRFFNVSSKTGGVSENPAQRGDRSS